MLFVGCLTSQQHASVSQGRKGSGGGGGGEGGGGKGGGSAD